MKRIKNIVKVLFLAGLPILFGSSLAYSAQCQAITQKGTQCTRQATAGSSFCWQHGGKASSVVVQKAQANNVSKAKIPFAAKTEGTKSTQCQAITKKGTQCKRQAEKGAVFCWQHGDKLPEAVIDQRSAVNASKSNTSAVAKPSEKASTQCQAITKKGTQCKRKAKSGSSYCWQHGG